MPRELCILLTRKIRNLGYPRRYAERVVRFLVAIVVLIYAVMDVLKVPVPAMWELTGRMDTCAAGSFRIMVLPAAWSIHR